VSTNVNPHAFCEILRQANVGDVALWHTGGGTNNPVLVLTRDEQGDAQIYVMFSCGWNPGEASFGLYVDDGESAPGNEPVKEWYGSGPSIVPMGAKGIAKLVKSKLKEWRADGLLALAGKSPWRLSWRGCANETAKERDPQAGAGPRGLPVRQAEALAGVSRGDHQGGPRGGEARLREV
jgi:hypothetical protein